MADIISVNMRIEAKDIFTKYCKDRDLKMVNVLSKLVMKWVKEQEEKENV